jgi:hypothetical protein
LFSEEEVADANSTFKAIGERREGDNTVITGELISIAVNVIGRITYDSRRVAGFGITFIFLKKQAPIIKEF